MARVSRRKFLKVSGAGALAAKAGGMAGILAAGRAPAYAQTTTVHWLRWNDFVPASDQLLRKEMLPEAEKATRHQDQLRDRQRQRPAAAHHVGDPVGRGPRPDHALQQPPATLRGELRRLSDVVEQLGKAEGGHYPLVKANSADGSKWLSMPWAIIGGMIAYRKSWFDEVGASTFPETWDEYREVGKKLKAKGRPIGQTLGHTFGDAPTFAYPLPVVVRRQGGRGRRQDRGHQHQGDDRVRQVHDRLLEGCPRRRRPRLGRLQQQPRVPLADHLGDAQRRLDLHRVAAQARQVQDREGRASSRPTSCTRRCPRGRPGSSPSTPTTRTCCRPIPRTRRRPRTS